MTNSIISPTMTGNIKLPISFIKNNGQMEDKVDFIAKCKNRHMFFSHDKIVVADIEHEKNLSTPSTQGELPQENLNGVVLELAFVDAKTDCAPEGVSKLPGQHHYFIGNNSAEWYSNVPHYAMLRYPLVWSGITLEVQSSDGLKMNWILDNPACASSIRLRWSGADALEIDETGNLLIHHALGTITDQAPIAWQNVDGKKIPVTCNYHLEDAFTLGFTLSGEYHSELPITIDPIIPYSTYLGGTGDDISRSISVDNDGCAYVSGTTNSIDFPVTPGAFQSTHSGNDSFFVTKLSPDGTSLIYSTYLGGSEEEVRGSSTIDGQGHVYITGATSSTDYPITPGAYEPTYPGGSTSIAITKLAPDGASLIYSTYLGGTGVEASAAIAVDRENCVYITGPTNSTDFPMVNPFQSVYAATNEITFVTKLNATGSELVYSTYIGGTGSQTGNGIDVDSQSCAYVIGNTNSTDFPVTTGAYQTTMNGMSNGFVTKFSSEGNTLVYSTYLGGTGFDLPNTVTVNDNDHACIVGQTNSPNFPVSATAYQSSSSGGYDGFITVLSFGGESLVGSTYLGGSAYDSARGVAVDAQGRVYVTGATQSADFPTTPEVIASTLTGTEDAFISILSPSLSTLLVSYYLGGDGTDTGNSIVRSTEGAIYTTGQTNSTDFPVTPGVIQPTLAGSRDSYITKTSFVFYDQASMVIQGLFLS